MSLALVMKQYITNLTKTVNFCGFRCATTSPITVFINVFLRHRRVAISSVFTLDIRMYSVFLLVLCAMLCRNNRII